MTVDPRGEPWTADEIARLAAWVKAARHIPYELVIDQFPGRTIAALKVKAHRIRMGETHEDQGQTRRRPRRSRPA